MDKPNNKSETKTTLQNFCTGTSMKGVPRILKSDTKHIKVMWLIAVLILLSLTMLNVTNLMISYFQYESLTLIREELLTINDSWNHYPSITLCNLNPLNSKSSDYIASKGLATISQFYDQVDTFLAKYKNKMDDDHFSEIRSNMLSFRAYKEYIGSDNGVKVGHALENFVIRCHILGTDSVHIHKMDCDDAATIERIVSPDFFNCYTLKVKKRTNMTLYKHFFVSGVTFVLYLDNFSPESPSQYMSTADTTQASGVRLFLHDQETVPLFSRGFDVGAGFSTAMFIQVIAKKKLSMPYGKCLSSSEYPELVGPDDHSVTARYRYTPQLCDGTCLQNHIKSECACTDASIPTGRDVWPFCGNISLNSETNLKYIDCMVKQYKQSRKAYDCRENCLTPCYSFSYENEVSMVPWPGIIYRKGFYNEFIRGMTYEQQFSSSGVNITNDPLDPQNTLKLLLLQRMVTENFLEVNLKLKSQELYVYEQTPKVTLTALMSQMGGALNLYAGVTLVVLVELMELIYNLFRGRRQNEPVNEVGTCRDTRDTRRDEMPPRVTHIW